jgi:hypothetical protein
MPYRYPKRSQYKYTKKCYRVRNWPEYESALRERRELTLWFSEEAIFCVARTNQRKTWRPTRLPKMIIGRLLQIYRESRRSSASFHVYRRSAGGSG